MRWTERQRAMLAEMGLRPWFRDDADVTTVDDPRASAVDADGDLATRTTTAAPAAPRSATAASAVATDAVPVPPPVRASVALATLAAEPEPESAAAWLIVDGPSESADDASRAAVEAEQALLLANMLRAIGVSSSQASGAAMRSLHVRTGTPAMSDLDRLPAQLRPRCVLVLGRAAAMALLGIDEPLGRLRGRVHAWRGIPVVVTFPLAYLLRNPGEKAKAWLDLCLAATAIDAPLP